MTNVDPGIIEFANEAFYLAFNLKDLDQMNALWSKDQACVCIHPGWEPIIGREEILQSWESIFSGDSPEVRCHAPRVISVEGVHSVICFEELPGGWLVATNNFILENGEARLIHHQASQCMPPDIEEAEPTLQ